MKNYFIFLTLLLIGLKAKAQDPNWSVNSANYQYSMTFTTFLNVNGTTLSSGENKVAAFVNGEIRGVANVVFVASANKYVAYLSVFANTNGETITFKIYDSANDNVVDITATENFIIDGNVGGIFQSYSIADPALNNEALLNLFSFKGVSTVSEVVNNNNVAVVLPFGTDITGLTIEYVLSNGANLFLENTKQLSGASVQDFTNTVTYKVLSENEEVFVEYEVSVTVASENVDPPVLVLTSAANSVVKQAPLQVNLTTNVAISNFIPEDVLCVNAVVSNIKKENELLYVLTVVPIQQGDFSIEIPQNKVLNSDNEGNSPSNKLTFIYDLVRPYVATIKRKDPTEEITKDDILEFTVTFSEDVENVSSSDFVSVSDATFTVVKENDSTYLITVMSIADFYGVVSLNIKPVNTIQDKAGNLLLNTVINVHQN
ncbi:hypothetical protein BTO04_12290 [Polaribacter sp. SA4-10]|uniref:hypothetical protein n=1 Tax=Polaribacter sp. SA4-10 TaxID=754397 RepID=UPI000B3BFB66|nr:hypothetical protein [Polaribacter sp. SA4-10]ARV07420.1 hypothetical protein BTO04_12290 [Polaribacter sp. SA4-10]